MSHAWNLPKLQAPLFIPSLSMWLGMLASNQPQVVSIVGLVIVIFWGKTSRGIALSMMLFAALGASHKIFHDRFQPVPARTECAEWRCTLSSHHDPLSRLYSCSSVYYPLGTLVEWTGNFPPALNRSFLAQLRPFRSRSNFDVARCLESVSAYQACMCSTRWRTG